MKEIGIEKLIELLNEYRTEKLRREMYVNGADKEAIELSEAERINEYEVSQTLDSLNYLRLFIKWLVENDKIDYEKIGTKIGMEYHKAYFPINKYWYVYDMETGSISSAEYSDYESLLMLLAIQEQPIRFLCEILK